MRTALVTGSNRGLGYAMSLKLLSRGWNVIAAARSWATSGIAQAQLNHAAKGAGTAIEFYPLDVASHSSRQGLIDKLRHDKVKLDAVINNAGIYLNEHDDKALEESLAVNCVGPLTFSRELLDAKLLHGHGACIVNVSTGYSKLRLLSAKYRQLVKSSKSIEDLDAMPFLPEDPMMANRDYVAVYKISKAALNHGTQLLAQHELKGKARLCSASPGWCKTDMGGAGAPRSAEEGADSIFKALDMLMEGEVESGYFVGEHGTVEEL